jgi:alkylation response protein AidB-like acyl-CoA dehydrogenase
MVPIAQKLEENDEPLPLAARQRYAEMGFLGVNIAHEYGGLGLSNLDALIVLEEFAKVSSAVAFPIFEASVGPIRAIEHFAPEELRRRVIPRVCRGEIVVAIAMSEPDAGSALTDLKTRARIAGDTIVVDGQKRWCSGGGHADGYVVYARMSDEPGAKGIGAVYVEKDTRGVSFGARERLMGFRGIASADIFFEEVTVPRENLIAPAGGFRQLMEAFDLERCGNATMSLGLAAGALEDAVAYVQERRQFGKPIVDFQAVQLKLAETAMRVEAARLLIWRAAANAEAGLPSVYESSIAKCFANEMVREACGAALQLFGGYGYAKEYPMERRLRDAWGWGIAGGTIDIQKINIASALVGRRFNQRA